MLKGLVRLGKAVNIGDAGLYAAVYLATFHISNVVTNNAAAALIFPIASTKPVPPSSTLPPSTATMIFCALN